MPEQKDLNVNQTVRCKAMHGNIEAMEYIINDLTPILADAHEKILYNHNDEAMVLMAQIKHSFEALVALYEANAKLNTNVL